MEKLPIWHKKSVFMMLLLAIFFYYSLLLLFGRPFIIYQGSFFNSGWILFFFFVIFSIGNAYLKWVYDISENSIHIYRVVILTASIVFACFSAVVTIPQTLHILSDNSFVCYKDLSLKYDNNRDRSKTRSTLRIYSPPLITFSAIGYSGDTLARFQTKTGSGRKMLADVCGMRSRFGFTVDQFRPTSPTTFDTKFEKYQIMSYAIIIFLIVVRYILSPIIYRISCAFSRSPQIPKDEFTRYNINYELYKGKRLTSIERFLVFRYFSEISSVWLFCIVVLIGVAM
jgi:hypothetical protein